MPSSATDILSRYWHFNCFRPLQKQIVDSVAAGHDTLGLMPTGGGKSIAFQVPALMLGGLAVVVTPLISLMKDQVDNLRRRGLKAVYFHSAMTSSEIRIAWERLSHDRCNFLYIAPERLRNERFLAELRQLKVSLIVVDEAHCISQWGYDFRPAYLEISRLRRAAPAASVVALTATATPAVVDDICRKLEFRPGFKVIRGSFARDNISYLVRPTSSKDDETIHILTHTQGPAIVYVRSRKRTSEMAAQLEAAGISAAAYHAGLPFEVKQQRQDDWMSGRCRVMVATNAFGMGIDKPDVRVVIHRDIPPSPEEYYQEAGRAGRDGLPSYAVLLRSDSDKGVLRRRVNEAFPPRPYIRHVYELLCVFFNIEIGAGYRLLRQFDSEKFCTTFSLRDKDCAAAMRILSSAGYIDYIEDGESRSRLMITTDREALYSVQTTSEAEKVLTKAMRLYPGLFTDYAYISEAMLARECHLDEQQIYEALLLLARQHIVSYIPRSRTPMVYFPTAREETDCIAIPLAIYEHRKQAISHRAEAMIDYAYGSHRCRVQGLLRYFGEDDAALCGKCDRCRDRRPAPPPPSEDVEAALETLLRKSGQAGTGIEQLQIYFGKYMPAAFATLQQWIAEGMAFRDDRGAYHLNISTSSSEIR